MCNSFGCFDQSVFDPNRHLSRYRSTQHTTLSSSSPNIFTLTDLVSGHCPTPLLSKVSLRTFSHEPQLYHQEIDPFACSKAVMASAAYIRDGPPPMYTAIPKVSITSCFDAPSLARA